MWLTAPLLLFTVGGFYQSPITPTPFSFFPFRYLCSWKCGDLSPWLRAMWLIYHSPHSNSSLLSLLQPLQTDPTSIQERKTCGAGERDCISTLSFHRAGHTTKQSGCTLVYTWRVAGCFAFISDITKQVFTWWYHSRSHTRAGPDLVTADRRSQTVKDSWHFFGDFHQQRSTHTWTCLFFFGLTV